MENITGHDDSSLGAGIEGAGNSSTTEETTTASELQVRLIEILQRISGAEQSEIHPGARLIEDIGIDSLGFYEILIEADECLGVKIREEDLLNFRTVGDIQRHLMSLESADGQNT